MKIIDIITEASLGAQSQVRSMAPARVSTLDRSAPWVKSAMKKARDFTQSIDAAGTVKEKFDILYNLKGKTNNNIRIGGGSQGSTYQIVSYDQATGNIELVLKLHSTDEFYSGNVNNFKYLGRERTVSGPKYYIFSPSQLTQKDSVSKERKTTQKTKQWVAPENPWIKTPAPIDPSQVRTIKKLGPEV